MSDLTDFLPEIKSLQKRFGFGYLVETGTGKNSHGLRVADAMGLSAYSCDVSEACVENASTMYPEAIVVQMESTAFLRNVCKQSMRESVFFWLDAHFSDSGVYLWPLFAELETLRDNRDCSRDVIWCDDMQHVADPLNPIRDQRVGFDLPDGTVWPGDTTHPIVEYVSPFLDTHTALIVGTVLRFTPKEPK